MILMQKEAELLNRKTSAGLSNWNILLDEERAPLSVETGKRRGEEIFWAARKETKIFQFFRTQKLKKYELHK